MNDKISPRTVVILGVIAAALSLAAAVIVYVREGRIEFTGVVAGLFFLVNALLVRARNP